MRHLAPYVSTLALLALTPMQAAALSKSTSFEKHLGNPWAIPVDLTYNEDAETRFRQKLEHRKPLSVFDKEVKDRMLHFLPQGKAFGVLYSSPQLSIEYIRSPDIFQVEIQTTDIQQAKETSRRLVYRAGV